MNIKPQTLTAVSIAVLLASSAACLIAPIEAATEFFPVFFWIHIAIIVLGIWATFRIRKIKSSWPEVAGALFPLPSKLVVLGVAAAAVALHSGKSLRFDMGTMPDGTVVHSKDWSERDGRYWLSLNNQQPVEITKVRYQELQRESYVFFALFWVLFSYIIVLEWHYVARREAQRTNAA
jgi:hypothetical protein